MNAHEAPYHHPSKLLTDFNQTTAPSSFTWKGKGVLNPV